MSQLRELKYRSRIFVKQDVTLYDIMNETNTLVENEIYCRTNREIIIDKVTITRALTLHLRDIQVVNAINVLDESSLNALHNYIVFN